MYILSWRKHLLLPLIFSFSCALYAQQPYRPVKLNVPLDVKLHRASLLNKPLPLHKPDTFTLVGVGDIMLGTNFPDESYLPPGDDASFMLEPVRPYLMDADLTFGNLEGVFAGEKGRPKNCNDPKTCYVFRMPDHYVWDLIESGFDVVSVANNHVNDFGYEGRMHSTSVLDEAGIFYAGFPDSPYKIFRASGRTIGFCAFSPNIGVMDLRDLTEAKRIVRLLADTCDIVIVSFHGGAEGSKHQHVTRQTEMFLGSNRGNVYLFAHMVIDAGADVVLGHGPHVTRAMEVYKGRFIAYSLGNFSTYARFNISGPNGIAPILHLKLSENGRFLGGKIIPIHQPGEGGARYDEAKRVIYKLQNLIQTDFPDNPLILDDDGIILPQ
ncbi:MAG: CapA family protein [Bacteroidota bacterium]